MSRPFALCLLFMAWLANPSGAASARIRHMLCTLTRTAGTVALGALLGGCNNSSLNENETTFHVRSLNLVEDSPTLEIELDDTTLFSAGYGSATSFTAGHPGQHTLSFSALLPADLADDDDDETSTPVSGASAYTFLAGTEYTVVAYGRLDDIRTFMIEGLDQREDVDDDKLVLQFTHASPDTPAVDVYVTAVKAGITSRYYVDTLAITETSIPLELSLVRDDDDLEDDGTLSADVVVELMASGSSDLLYRSGATSFAEQNRILMAIADSNGPGPAATKLLSYFNASANCSALTPSTSTVLRRLVSPAVMCTRDFAMPSWSAMNSINAALAAPSTGGAANLIFTQPSCMPATAVLLARGCTYTLMRCESAIAVNVRADERAALRCAGRPHLRSAPRTR